MSKMTRIFRGHESIHFIGIGGSGMSGIAEILINLGFKVTGSDVIRSDTTAHLKKLGAGVFTGHKASNINGADVIVYSSAINRTNPEIKKARALKIPIVPRAEMLAELMRLKRGIAVAGTHGKTTTSSIIGNIFYKANLKPTVIIGGKVFNIGSSARLGRGEFLICEADESDGSFLMLSPEIVIVTNIDNDHLDYYHNMENLKNAFIEFINKIPFYGFAVICFDDKILRSVIPHLQKRIKTYGISKGADYLISNIKNRGRKTFFDLTSKEKKFHNIKINNQGIHNVLNSAACITAGVELGLDIKMIQKGLDTYQGVERRLEYTGIAGGIRIMDDYGHHPTEIAATLNTVSINKDYKNLIVVFQPHRYTRTKILYKDFKDSFIRADNVIIMDIYPAGEKKIEGVTSKLIFNAVKKRKKKGVFYIPRRKDVINRIKQIAKKGDMILTLGAGDIKFLGKELLEVLK